MCGLHKVTSEGLKVPTVYSRLLFKSYRGYQTGCASRGVWVIRPLDPCVVMQQQVQVEAAVQKLLLPL